MNAAVGIVIGISALTLVVFVVVGWMLWRSRISQGGESAEDRYRRSHMELHSPRNRRAMRAKQRRKTWAAGSAGAAGIGYPGHGGSDSGCGGGAGCGGGGCGGGGGS